MTTPLPHPIARVAIVYHSAFGHTEVVAREIAQGASSVERTRVDLVPVADLPKPPKPGPSAKPEAKTEAKPAAKAEAKAKAEAPAWSILHNADAIILGSPTYMGSVSAEMKAFMDSTGAVWSTQRWKDKLAAGFTNAAGLSGDKLHALVTLSLFAAQHSMIWVSQGVFSTDDGLNRMSAWLGLMTQSENASPDITPPEEDRATARLFGERVALTTHRWVRGGVGQ